MDKMLARGLVPLLSPTRGTTKEVEDIPTDFGVYCNGQIHSIQYPGINNAYCHYTFVSGVDWTTQRGADHGVSQLAYKVTSSPSLVLNFPIDIAYASTNPFGWPQLIVCVYGLDFFGRDVVLGYGSMRLPTRPGSYDQEVLLFRPVSSSFLHQIYAWFWGSPPEFVDPTFITQGRDRQLTRVTSSGHVQVQLNITTTHMESFGYS